MSLLLKTSRDLLIGINFRIVTQTDCLISNIVHTARCPYFPLGVFRRRAGTERPQHSTFALFEDISGSPLTDKN